MQFLSFFLFLFALFVSSGIFIQGRSSSSCGSSCCATWNGQSIDISGLANITDTQATSFNECSYGDGYLYAVSLCRPVSSSSGTICNFDSANFCQISCTTGFGCPRTEDTSVSVSNLAAYSFLVDQQGNQIGVQVTGTNLPNGQDKQGIIQLFCPSAQGAPASPITSASFYPTSQHMCNGHVFQFSDELACDLVKGKDLTQSAVNVMNTPGAELIKMRTAEQTQQQ